MEFETLLKIIVGTAAAAAIPVAAYAAVAATRAIWIRHPAGDPEELDRLSAEVEALKGRLQVLESAEARVGELEERVDFTERLLVEQREREAPRLGLKGGSA